MLTLTLLLTRTEEGFAAECPEMPGCHSQGDTPREALANLFVAVEEWLTARDPVWRALNGLNS
jgi:antitoxin HicB